MPFGDLQRLAVRDACDAVGLMISLISENDGSWSSLDVFSPTVLTCPFSCGAFEQVLIAGALCAVREAQCKQKANLLCQSCLVLMVFVHGVAYTGPSFKAT